MLRAPLLSGTPDAVAARIFLLYFGANCVTLPALVSATKRTTAATNPPPDAGDLPGAESFLPRVPPRRRRRVRLDLILAFVACVVLVNAVVGERGLVERWRARRDYRALVAGVAALRQSNQALREEARRLREDPRSIEMIARRELGLARRGEILVVVRTSRR